MATVLLVALAVGSGAPVPFASDAGSSPADDPFPVYERLNGHVEFWARVFSEWQVGQVVAHDMDYPAIVYETVRLHGPKEFPYTEQQLEFVGDLREKWEARLEDLERKVEARASLTDGEKKLFLKIAAQAGGEAVRDAHARVRTQRGLRERFRRGIEVGEVYMKRFRKIFREKGLPEDLAYLPHVESSFQASARSSAGALGIWQFTRGTGRKFLVINSALDERLDPVAATQGAAEYFKLAYDLLGNWALAVTSFNHGLQGMQRAKKQFGTDFERIQREYESRAFGFASQNFYAEFLAAREIARAPERYFPEGLSPEPAPELDHVVLRRRTSPGGITREYGVPLKELSTLNPGWTRRAVERGYALPAGTTVWLPKDTMARVERERASRMHHVVSRGETLSSIALRFGLTVDELRHLNGIPKEESLILVGQKLLLRSQEETSGETGLGKTLVHVVRLGETLIKIAAIYEVRLADLLVANHLTEKTTIYPGQELHIPSPR